MNSPLASTPALDPATTEALMKSITTMFRITEGDAFLEDKITDLKRINEKEMYAATVHFSLGKRSSQLSARFEEILPTVIERVRTDDGDLHLYKAVGRTLRMLIRWGELTREQFRTIRLYAFGKAQFDSDRTQLATLRAEDAEDGDTPVRAIRTAIRKFSENSQASSEEFGIFRKRAYQNWRQRRQAKKAALS